MTKSGEKASESIITAAQSTSTGHAASKLRGSQETSVPPCDRVPDTLLSKLLNSGCLGRGSLALARNACVFPSLAVHSSLNHSIRFCIVCCRVMFFVLNCNRFLKLLLRNERTGNLGATPCASK